MWKLNNMLFNNHWVKEETKKDIRKYLKTNENETTKYQNLWDARKTEPRGKFIVINAYVKKKSISNKQPNFTHQGAEKNKLSPKLAEGRK